MSCVKVLDSQKHTSLQFIMQSNPLLEKLSKQVNKDLSHFSNWLKVNKLSFNVKKTELVIFGPRKLKIVSSVKFKLAGKRLAQTHFFKYLGVLTDEHVLWNKQIAQIKKDSTMP